MWLGAHPDRHIAASVGQGDQPSGSDLDEIHDLPSRLGEITQIGGVRGEDLVDGRRSFLESRDRHTIPAITPGIQVADLLAGAVRHYVQLRDLRTRFDRELEKAPAAPARSA